MDVRWSCSLIFIGGPPETPPASRDRSSGRNNLWSGREFYWVPGNNGDGPPWKCRLSLRLWRATFRPVIRPSLSPTPIFIPRLLSPHGATFNAGPFSAIFPGWNSRNRKTAGVNLSKSFVKPPRHRQIKLSLEFGNPCLIGKCSL